MTVIAIQSTSVSGKPDALMTSVMSYAVLNGTTLKRRRQSETCDGFAESCDDSLTLINKTRHSNACFSHKMRCNIATNKS